MDVTDAIYLMFIVLDTNPVIKYLLLTKKKKNNFGLTILLKRVENSENFTLFPKLLAQQIKFFEYMHIYPSNFYYILENIQHFLQKQSNFMKYINTCEKTNSYFKVSVTSKEKLFNLYHVYNKTVKLIKKLLTN